MKSLGELPRAPRLTEAHFYPRDSSPDADGVIGRLVTHNTTRAASKDKPRTKQKHKGLVDGRSQLSDMWAGAQLPGKVRWNAGAVPIGYC